jgi:UDP-N-acetylglucosamine 4-epimerase|tara:strand:- start:1513 stop:2547 length:1035 start_codon:yes stop_codon:yes gene_type:complete
MNQFAQITSELQANKKKWVITGVAGFIGSNLLEALLKLDQDVIGLDNFSTGSKNNLQNIEDSVSDEQWLRFKFVEGDILDANICEQISKKADYILHQAALGSVPRSIEDPVNTNNSNISGFLNMLVAARDAGVSRFVYAASSSTYGDHPALPKLEENIGKPLSPYAVTKLANELYAEVFANTYNLHSVGLRYFNIFGRRQAVNSSYAAVIPKWVGQILNNAAIQINGDGETSRDFTYIDNVIQANILAATVDKNKAISQIYNIAAGERTSLIELHHLISTNLQLLDPSIKVLDPEFLPFRAGDVRHSLADITKAHHHLGYEPTHNVSEGIKETVSWYIKNQNAE